MTSNLGIGKLRDMQNDIKNLRSKVADYYAQYDDIPVRKDVEYTNIANIEKAGVISSAVDTGKFYVIELSSLDNLTLTYGKDYEQVKAGSDPNSLTDLYIINEASHNIFYVAGIPLDGEWFYTDYTSDQIDTEEIPRRVVDGVAIPENFYYAGGTKEEGLVISDVEGDDLENSKGGNQFVWIPVENYDEFVRQEGYAGGNIASMLSNSGEADSAGKNENQNGDKVEETGTTKQEAMAMYESVKTYGGFYIGRFETGKDEEGNVVIRKGVTPYNKVPWSVTGNMTEDENIDGTENGAIEQARYFAKANGYTSVKSTLCYGVQWDAALNYIDPKYITNAEAIGKPSCEETSYVRDSSGKGNYFDSDSTNNPGQTGAKDEYNIKNIYDLAGNVYEWTMESCYTNVRVYRGGYYSSSGSDSPSSLRNFGSPDIAYSRFGFRTTLYL